MSAQKSKLNQTLYYFFALLIIYLPFQRLLEQILLNRGFAESLAFWATHWHEPFIIILVLLNCFFAGRSKCPFCHPEEPNTTNDLVGLRFFSANWRIGMTIYLVITLIVLSIISIFIFSPSISRGIEGFRFTAFFLLAFLAAYCSSLTNSQVNKLTNIYLIVAGLFALWGITEQFLPPNYLVTLGLIAADSNFGFGTHKVVDVLQSVTGIGGPNQLASYLLPAIFLAIVKLKDSRTYELKNNLTMSEEAKPISDSDETMKQFNKGSLVRVIYCIVTIICVVAIALTFSRSAWLGLYMGLLISAILLIKNFWLKIVSILLLLVLAAGVGFYYLNKPNDILTHGASDTGHQSALQISLSEIQSRFIHPVTLLFGSGIGTAGPAALKYGDGFISESWYLQLALELGVIGLIAWILLIVFILFDLYKKNKGLFLGLISVSVAAIFLHTFADNPAMSITLFALIGMNLKTRQLTANSE